MKDIRVIIKYDIAQIEKITHLNKI